MYAGLKDIVLGNMCTLSYPEVDLSGKVAIVTGGNTGIGYETAKGLARLGAHTFIACRNKERAKAAIERMNNELGVATVEELATPKAAAEVTPEATDAEGPGEEVKSKEGEKVGEIEYLPLDLSSFQSTKDFVHLFKEKDLPLHILVNNAGIAFLPYEKTADGFEIQFQVNHLSHMLLTLELLPLLQDTAAQSGDVRIVIVASIGHQMAPPFDPTRLNRTESEFIRSSAYANTKLYNIMMGYALQRRLPDKNITVSSIQPGFVDSDIFRGFKDKTVLSFFTNLTTKVFARKPVDGAATSLNCAVNPDLNSQRHMYYDSCQPTPASADARNESFQEELWKRSIEFLKDHLSPEILEKYGHKLEQENTEYETASQIKGSEAPAAGQETVAVQSPGLDTTAASQNEGGAPRDANITSSELVTEEGNTNQEENTAREDCDHEPAKTAETEGGGEDGGANIAVKTDVREGGVAEGVATPSLNGENEEGRVESGAEETGSQQT